MQLIKSDVANLSLAWIGASEGRILPSDALPRENFMSVEQEIATAIAGASW